MYSRITDHKYRFLDGNIQLKCSFPTKIGYTIYFAVNLYITTCDVISCDTESIHVV